MSQMGLGGAKTQSDLVVMPCRRRIFAFACTAELMRCSDSTKGAITGREQMQQRHAPMRCYSISSSARAISLSEMVSPSALAVVRVMTRGLIVHFFNHAAPGGSAQADRNSADRVPAWMSPKYCIHAAFCSRVIGMPLRSSLFELYSCAMIRTGQRIESDSPTAMKEGPSTIDGATRSTSR